MFKSEISELKNLEIKYKGILEKLEKVGIDMQKELSSVEGKFVKETAEINRIQAEKLKNEKALSSMDSDKNQSIKDFENSSVIVKAKQRIESAYRVCKNAFDFLLKIEEEFCIARDKLLTRLQKKTEPDYDKENVLAELRENYKKFESLCAKITSIYSVSQNKELAEELVLAYLNIEEIYTYRDAYISKVFKKDSMISEISKEFSDKKSSVAVTIDAQKQTVSKLEAEKKDKISKAESEIRAKFEKEKGSLQVESVSVRSSADKLFKDLEEKISIAKRENEKLPFLSKTPMISTDYSKAVWYLGMASRGNNVVKFDKFNKSVALPDETPFCIDLTKPANVLIEYPASATRDSDLWNIVKCLAMNFVLCYPEKNKKIAAVHNESISNFSSIISCVKDCCDGAELIFHSNEVNSEKMSMTIREVVAEINRRRNIASNIIEYNKENPDNVYPLILFFVKDVDFSYGNDAKEIQNITEYGNAVGVYTVLLTDSNKLKGCKDLYKEKNLSFEKNFPYTFTYEDGLISDGEVDVDCLVNLDNFNKDYIAKINAQLKGIKKSIDFMSFHKEAESKITKSSSEITLPIGKHGASLVTMSLRSDSPASHSAIEGKSGSGKSAFMHSIILSAAYHYSPEEMDIIILDFMANGKDFEPYKKLKHVKYMSMDASSADVVDLMDFISAKYSDVVKKPRAIVAIDEYTSMGKEARERLVKWAKQLRKNGVCLLLASQEASFDEVKNEVSHKFEMYKDSRYLLIDDVHKYGQLTPSGRMVIYQGLNGVHSMFYPYAGDKDGMAKIIEEINNKYASSKYVEPVILGKTKDLSLDSHSEADVKLDDDKWSIKVPLGEDAVTGIKRVYKIDKNNRRLFLFGDQERASAVEYLIGKAYKSFEEGEPTFYYLNFATSKVNTVLKKLAEDNGAFSKSPIDAVNVLKRVYKLYRERFNMVNNGEEIEYPVEVVFHGAQRMESIFEMSKNAPSSTKRNKIDVSNIDDIDVLTKMLHSDDEPEEETFENISLREMFNDICHADEALKINVILHYTTATDAENSRIFSLSEEKDFILVPAIPDEDDEVSYAGIIADLGVLRLSEYREKYTERITLNMSAQALEAERNNLKKLIIIDEKQPHEYVPYED